MRVELRNIIDEIEAAQRDAGRTGRKVETAYLTSHDEVIEFKKVFAERMPESEDKDDLFTGETFWKGTRIKLERKGDSHV